MQDCKTTYGLNWDDSGSWSGYTLSLIHILSVRNTDRDMKREETRDPDYPLFKGLQRPLELMGRQGRYIYWAATAAGGAIVGFIVAYCLFGFREMCIRDRYTPDQRRDIIRWALHEENNIGLVVIDGRCV